MINRGKNIFLEIQKGTIPAVFSVKNVKQWYITHGCRATFLFMFFIVEHGMDGAPSNFWKSKLSPPSIPMWIITATYHVTFNLHVSYFDWVSILCVRPVDWLRLTQETTNHVLTTMSLTSDRHYFITFPCILAIIDCMVGQSAGNSKRLGLFHLLTPLPYFYFLLPLPPYFISFAKPHWYFFLGKHPPLVHIVWL